VDFDAEVYTFGLHSRLDLARCDPDTAERLVAARPRLGQHLARASLGRLVEAWDGERYNGNATVAENVLFGKPVGPAFADENLARQPYLRRSLDDLGLTGDLVRMGRHVAEEMIEIFGNLAGDNELIDEFSLIRAEDVPLFRAILGRAKDADPAMLPPADRSHLLSLAFKIVAARHRFDFLDETMQGRLVAARQRFAAELPAALRGSIAFFDPTGYNPAASIAENVVFGKIALSEADGRERVGSIMAELLDECGLRGPVIEAGLDYRVGTGGSRLSPAQRQKASLARALLKRPDVLVVNEATAALDGPAQTRILDGLRREFAGRCLIWSVHQVRLARHFDRVLVLDGGRLVAQGTFDELEKPDGALAGLMAAE
jgi:putative ABC transport system ATP-binding protein